MDVQVDALGAYLEWTDRLLVERIDYIRTTFHKIEEVEDRELEPKRHL